MFKAILVEKDDQGYRAGLQAVDPGRLPEGDVLVRVSHSTLNYKDALAITGRSPVVRSFPMVPGIDFVGAVQESAGTGFKAGDRVVLNGWGVGEAHWGGLAQLARVKSQWLIRLPDGMQPDQAMAIGTAGYTAMLCIMALQRHGLTPQSGDILVTGAAGGVGSIAIALLSSLGYRVLASTGRPEEADYLQALGAADIIDRKTLSEPGKPLGKERWAGAVDSVGSHTLANVCAGTRYRGIVAACGLAQGLDFPATVAPFILRNVTLAGIDSVMCPLAERQQAWNRLAKELDRNKLSLIGSRTIGLSDVVDVAQQMLTGRVRGRLVVDVDRD
ncbi:MAG: MDR family oxidoreductase [Candidimonas sp.]